MDIGLVSTNHSAYFEQEPDGSFTARFNVKGNYHGDSDSLVIYFTKEKSLNFRIEYENGWFFDRNGLAEQNRECFEHIIETPREAVERYISATGDKTEITETLNEVKRLSDEICTGITSDYEKAEALCAWVSANICYDFDARNTDVSEDTVALHNVLERKRTVCAGFANTLAVLLKAQNIRALNIKGSCAAGEVTYEKLATGVENHEWVAIELDGRWFFADATWNTTNKYINGSFSYGLQNLMYFDPSDEAFAFDHRADRAQERDYFACLDTDN